jgi:hypothetical protein
MAALGALVCDQARLVDHRSDGHHIFHRSPAFGARRNCVLASGSWFRCHNTRLSLVLPILEQRRTCSLVRRKGQSTSLPWVSVTALRPAPRGSHSLAQYAASFPSLRRLSCPQQAGASPPRGPASAPGSLMKDAGIWARLLRFAGPAYRPCAHLMFHVLVSATSNRALGSDCCAALCQ